MSFVAWEFLAFTGMFILLGWGVYIVYRGGQLYNAPVFTMLIGAYSSAFFVKFWDWPFVLACLVGVAMGAAAAFLPSIALGRAPAFTTAIATIALIFIAQTIVRNWRDPMGAEHGMYHIPDVPHLLPMIWIAVVIVGFFIYRFDHSRFGRAAEATFVDPDLAATMGVNVIKLRRILQVAAGAIGALSGTFYGFVLGALMPQAFSFALLLYLFCFLFVGGYTTMWGVVVFTPILWSVSVFLPPQIADFRMMVYGTVLIVILLLRSYGVIDRKLLRAITTRLRRAKLVR